MLLEYVGLITQVVFRRTDLFQKQNVFATFHFASQSFGTTLCTRPNVSLYFDKHQKKCNTFLKWIMQTSLVTLRVDVPKTRFLSFGTILEHMINRILHSCSCIIEFNIDRTKSCPLFYPLRTGRPPWSLIFSALNHPGKPGVPMSEAVGFRR